MVSVLGARVMAGSRTGVSGLTGLPQMGSGEAFGGRGEGQRPEGPGVSCAGARGQ